MNEFWWALAGCGVFWLVLVWGLGRWDRKKSLAPLAEKDGMLDHAMLLAALRAADAKDNERGKGLDFFGNKEAGNVTNKQRRDSGANQKAGIDLWRGEGVADLLANGKAGAKREAENSKGKRRDG